MQTDACYIALVLSTCLCWRLYVALFLLVAHMNVVSIGNSDACNE